MRTPAIYPETCLTKVYETLLGVGLRQSAFSIEMGSGTKSRMAVPTVPVDYCSQAQ